MSDLLERAEPQAVISFSVPGEIRGKGRARSRLMKYTDKGTGQRKEFISHYTDSETTNYEAKIGTYAMKAKAEGAWQMTNRPVKLEILAIFPIKDSWTKKKKIALAGAPCPQKPDGDNIFKSVADGCNGVLYEDDKQITEFRVNKRYVKAGDNFVGVFVRVSECV